ncbi:MAG: glycosyltransferase family 4 protein [Actinobacteria bacterium]|nr:MAG: glycosyltransferase family 4 protein [Actinomycetota bacterium]
MRGPTASRDRARCDARCGCRARRDRRRPADLDRCRLSRRALRAPALSSSSRAQAGRGRTDDPLLRLPVDDRDGRHLAADHARPARSRSRLDHDAGGPLPHRTGPADRAYRRELARPPRPAHRADPRLGGRARGERARRDSQVHGRCRGAHGRRRAGLLLRDALARSDRVRGSVLGRRHRGANRPARGGDPVRDRLDEVAPGDRGQAPAANRHARARDHRRDSARRRPRCAVGRHRRRSRGPRLDDRLRGSVGCRDRPPARDHGRRPDAARRRHRAVKVLVVTGIWPPDPGGPASHAPALARFLRGRGHTVEVVTTAVTAPAAQQFEIHWISRRAPAPLRHLRVANLVRTYARAADVVYATSMVRRAAIGAAAARKPLVVKLVSDEVFERQQRSGRFEGTLEEFQVARGARVTLLRGTRNRALRRASHVFCPSAYLRDFALGWGIDPERVSVLPNPAPDLPSLPPREEIRSALQLDGHRGSRPDTGRDARDRG